MKTLANCNPVDFLRQTNKIRHAVSGWLAETGVLEIRKRAPELTGMETPEESERKKRDQAKKNLDAMLDSMMEHNAEQTAKVLGLMCFMDPEEIETAKGVDFLTPALELLSSKPVIDFTLIHELGADEYGRLISCIRLDLLEVFGKEYVSQHILQTFRAERREENYRIYVTDVLQVIAENTAINANKFLTEPVGKAMTRRWIERDRPLPLEETRTAEEVIDHIKRKLEGGGIV